MRILLFAGCCVTLAYGLFRPESPPQLFEQSDKALHLLAFAVLSLTARPAFPRLSGWGLWPFLMILAPLLEYLQHYLQPSRQFSSMDMAANLAGVVLGWLGWHAAQLVWRRIQPTP